MKEFFLVFRLGLFATLILCIASAIGCSRDETDTVEEERVVEAFRRYKFAILRKSGNAAYELVDQNTRVWYADTLERAMTWDRSKIMSLGLIDKIQVLTVRYRLYRDFMQELDGEALFKYAVDKGWIGEDSVKTLHVGDVKIDGNSATAAIVTNGKITPVRLKFNRENGDWRIDLVHLSKMAEPTLSAQIKKSGRSEIDVIFKLIESSSHDGPGRKEIWTPAK